MNKIRNMIWAPNRFSNPIHPLSDQLELVGIGRKWSEMVGKPDGGGGGPLLENVP